jgi:hypothetical protein
LGPGVRSDQVEFIAGPSTHGAWLFAPGDLLVTKINGAGATLIMSSLRAPGGEVLSIKVERLEARADAGALAQSAIAATPPEANATTAQKRRTKHEDKPAGPVFKSPGDNLPLPIQIGAHIRTRGDMSFTNVPWAGRVAPGLWIESFSVRPLEQFAAKDIEYKGLTGSGFETPWLSDDKMCGTKGMAVPLVGFAVRLKPSETSAAYDCEYSGFFQSGVTVGPLRNGAPCRSTVANDPLEGIQVRLIKRSVASPLTAAAKTGVSAAPTAKTVVRAAVKAAKRPAAGRRRPTRHARQNRQSSTRRP